MGTRIHLSDPYVGVDIAQESTYGTPKTSGFYRIHPLVDPGETGTLVREQLDRAVEYSVALGRTSYDYGRSHVAGALTMLVSYNDKALGLLMKELTGGYAVAKTNAYSPSGVLPAETPTGYAVTLFYSAPMSYATTGYAGGVGKGLTIRAWKAGKTATASETVDRFCGCVVTGAVFEQDANQRLRVTFTWLGTSLEPQAANAAVSDEALASVQSDLVPCLFRDIDSASPDATTCEHLVATGPDYTNDLNLDSFRISIDKKMEIPSSYITSPDTVSKPFRADVQSVTGELRLRVEQDYLAADKPHKEYLDATTGGEIRIRYVSPTMIYDTSPPEDARLPYALEFWFGNTGWADSRPNLSQLGDVPHVLQFEAVETALYPVGEYAEASTSRSGVYMIQLVNPWGSFPA